MWKAQMGRMLESDGYGLVDYNFNLVNSRQLFNEFVLGMTMKLLITIFVIALRMSFSDHKAQYESFTSNNAVKKSPQPTSLN